MNFDIFRAKWRIDTGVVSAHTPLMRALYLIMLLTYPALCEVTMTMGLNENVSFRMCFTTSSGQPYLGPIHFESAAQSMSGGHSHNNDGKRPKGSLQYPDVYTTDGCVNNRFYGTDIAGTHQVVGYPQPFSSIETLLVNVKVNGLQAFPASANYSKEGSKSIHPDGWWATQNVLNQMELIAAAFRQGFGKVTGVNDASLAWGGRFDLGPAYPGGIEWKAPHGEHMRGLNVDCPFRFLDPKREDFLKIAIANGGGAGYGGVYEHADHYHLRFAN